MAMDEKMKGILTELEPAVEVELDRHLSTAEPWSPHEWIRWSEGRDFARLGGEDWDPRQSTLRPVAQKALILNLLTEDNLPSYHFELASAFGRDGAWGHWVGQWTAEENRHATAMRDFLVTSRAADPDALEAARMPHMTAGYRTVDKNPLDVTAYVTMQELATAVSHGNTGKMIAEDGDQVGGELMTRIAADERRHYVFYLNMGAAAFQIEPNLMMQSFAKEVAIFDMPGKETIPNYDQDATAIAEAGIYNIPLHVGRVLKPIMKHWKILEMEGLSGKGAEAQDFMGQYLPLAEAKAERRAALYEEIAAKKAAEQDSLL
jgi:acyl-[acyl-carrier-protein] desaturase